MANETASSWVTWTATTSFKPENSQVGARGSFAEGMDDFGGGIAQRFRLSTPKGAGGAIRRFLNGAAVGRSPGRLEIEMRMKTGGQIYGLTTATPRKLGLTAETDHYPNGHDGSGRAANRLATL